VTEVPTAVNQGFIAMVCDKALPNLYVLRWAEANMDVIKGRANGTTFMEVSKTAFRPIQMVMPPPETLAAFMEIAGSLHARGVSNLKESTELATARDALLPRLLSGDLRLRSGGMQL
jgi:type I restriction enzyme S subunit